MEKSPNLPMSSCLVGMRHGLVQDQRPRILGALGVAGLSPSRPFCLKTQPCWLGQPPCGVWVNRTFYTSGSIWPPVPMLGSIWPTLPASGLGQLFCHFSSHRWVAGRWRRGRESSNQQLSGHRTAVWLHPWCKLVVLFFLQCLLGRWSDICFDFLTWLQSWKYTFPTHHVNICTWLLETPAQIGLHISAAQGIRIKMFNNDHSGINSPGTCFFTKSGGLSVWHVCHLTVFTPYDQLVFPWRL